MAKVVVRVPFLKWENQQIRFPEDKAEIVRARLQERQNQIAQSLAKRNEEVARKIEEAVRPKPSPKSKLMNPKTIVFLALGALAGVGIGLMLAPKPSPEARSKAQQKVTGYINTARSTATDKASTLAEKARSRAGGGAPVVEVEPETVTSEVQTSISQDSSLRSLNDLTVGTEPGGIVYLRGTAQTYAQRERAEQVARKVHGVSDVVNEINVESGPAS